MELQENLWSNKLEFTADLYRSLADKPLSYVYHGGMTSYINERTLSLAEDNFDHLETPSKLKRRVFYIMVECLQNITKHQDRPGYGLNTHQGLFVLQDLSEGKYRITSGNVINNTKVDHLQEQLAELNQLKRSELTNRYKDILFSGELSEKGGAGLGLIDMARKANSKLNFDFKAIGAKQSYFYFQTDIPEQEDDRRDESDSQGLEDVKELHKTMSANHVQLVYKGSFTQESVKQLVLMIEGNMVAMRTEPIQQKRVFNVMVELLQNIAKHADKDPNHYEDHKLKPGIFMLGQDDHRRLLTAGNWVHYSKVNEFKAKLQNVNHLQRTALLDLYDEILVQNDTDQKGGAGLGLIDMRLKSRSPLHFDFSERENDHVFFTLQVEI